MAEHVDPIQYNNQRTLLSKALPLKMPYSVKIFVSNICNFRCFYCYQSKISPEENASWGKLGLQRKLMDLDLYCQCIDGIARQGRLKKLLIYGNGEPLIHPHIGEMVRYAKKMQVAEVTEVVTNASLLTRECSNALIAAGLDHLRVSLQGLNASDYKRRAEVKLDYEELFGRLTYFYNHRGKTRVYIKLLDVMLRDRKQEEAFYRRFEPICDEIAVENLVPLVEMEGIHEWKKGMRGNDRVHTDICSMAFYSCTVDCDGEVAPCCRVPFPCKFGSARDFGAVWNGEEYRRFLLHFLEGRKEETQMCRGCQVPEFLVQPNDYLDASRDTLAQKYRRT